MLRSDMRGKWRQSKASEGQGARPVPALQGYALTTRNPLKGVQGTSPLVFI